MQYEAPGTVDEAVALLAGSNGAGRVLAGGSDLLVQLRSGLIEPGLVVDVKGIEEMTSIAEDANGFRIGAAVCAAALEENENLKAAWPGVVEAARLIGSEQIQSRASLGGNLCNGSPAADTVPAMIAAGAVCNIAGPDGPREANVEDIVTGPGKTSLKPGELVVSISLPAAQAKTADAYLRFIPRTEMDIAVVGAGICLQLGDDGKVAAARAGLGAVAPTPLLATKVADALIGWDGDAAGLEDAAAAASAACNPIDDKRGTVEYRTKVAGVLTKRAALIAYERAGAK